MVGEISAERLNNLIASLKVSHHETDGGEFHIQLNSLNYQERSGFVRGVHKIVAEANNTPELKGNNHAVLMESNKTHDSVIIQNIPHENLSQAAAHFLTAMQNHGLLASAQKAYEALNLPMQSGELAKA